MDDIKKMENEDSRPGDKETASTNEMTKPPAPKPSRSASGGRPKKNSHASQPKHKNKPTKKSIKKVRGKRRLQQRQEAEEEERKKARKTGNPALENHPGNIIIADPTKGEDAETPEDFFWEVDTVIGRRVKRGRVEYLIRWKNCTEDDNTWEPASNLCDTAMEEAMRYVKNQKEKAKQREEDERKLFGDVGAEFAGEMDAILDNVIDQSTRPHAIIDGTQENSNLATASEVSPGDQVGQNTEIIDDNYWKWSDKEQVEFHDVERINVNDKNALARVKDARINGTPIVLVGHVGWANFAKRWLKKKQIGAKYVATIDGNKLSRDEMKSRTSLSNDVDLSDVRMSERNESETNDESKPNETSHAWKLSEEAGGNPTSIAGTQVFGSIQSEKKSVKDETNELLDLSGEVYELDIMKMIEDIGDEDVPVIKRNYNEVTPIHGNISAAKFLTNCWPTSDSSTPTQQTKTSQRLYLHQWQFPLSDTAGRKLCHQNNPLPKEIMGEDMLKYWIDLPQCKLDSPLQYIFMGREDTLSKLHKDNGGLDISIAPIVGHKECVLVHRSDGSNCLYRLDASLEDIDLHRFPLMSQARVWKTVIKPGEILLMPQGTYHQCRNLTPCLSYSRFHLDSVNLLPFLTSLLNRDAPEIDHEDVLWNLTSEMVRKVDEVFDEAQARVKEGLDTADLLTEEVVDTVNTLRTLRHFVREVARREEVRKIVKGSCDRKSKNSDDAQKKPDDDTVVQDFSSLVEDVDLSLHEFRYRSSTVIPPFKARKGKALKNILSGPSGRRSSNVIKRDVSKFAIGGKPVVTFNSALDNNYMSLVNADILKNYPNASRKKVGEALIGKLKPGDQIVVKLEQRHVKGEIQEVIPQMKAAYLSFEEFPSIYDEYQPYDLVRFPNGEEIPEKDVKPGLVVIDISTDNNYRAEIQSTYIGPMARVKFFVSQHTMTRLVSPSLILDMYTPKSRAKKNDSKGLGAAEVIEISDEEKPERPNKVGQVVKVDGRGAARVTKVYRGGAPQDGNSFPTHVDVCFILGSMTTEKMIPIDHVKLAPELDPEKGRGHRQIAKQHSSPVSGNLARDGSVVSPNACA
mmetsp:Transcript_26829/g.54753  ORF Transcript_26829/g.54753 Transcript_26829/m.54753 type:complete len:1082 (-) Transcript_26829:207-3452(-)